MSPHSASRLRASTGRPPSGLPDRVIVIGDLHMGAGHRAEGGVDPLEHFFQDQAFAAIIGRLAGSAARRGRRVRLVLNGDAFDFVRIVRLPASEAEVQAWAQLLVDSGVRPPPGVLAAAVAGAFTALQRRYGFDTAEHESIWKVWALAQGHPQVFAALADWCRAGHELVVVRGNHDVEWAWPGMRRAFRQLLRRSGSGPLGAAQVRFRLQHDHLANLHVEHGHLVSWTTAVEGRFTPGPGRRLRQPFGSFINRYLLNPLERAEAPSPGLASSARLRRLLRQEPLTLWRRLLQWAFRGIGPLGRATWGMWHRRAHRWWPTRLGNAVGISLLALPLLPPELLARLALSSTPARTATALLAFATPHLGLAVLEIVDTIRGNPAIRARAFAQRIAARWQARCGPGDRIVVLGHAHRAELSSWQGELGRVVYANPGSWTADDETEGRGSHFVWCASDGRSFRRSRVMVLDGGGARCRTRFRG